MRLDRKVLRLLRMEDAVTLASVAHALLEDPAVRRLKVKESDITCAPPTAAAAVAARSCILCSQALAQEGARCLNPTLPEP